MRRYSKKLYEDADRRNLSIEEKMQEIRGTFNRLIILMEETMGDLHNQRHRIDESIDHLKTEYRKLEEAGIRRGRSRGRGK